MTSVVCLYFGPRDQCKECGGFDPTGTGLCGTDCQDSWAVRQQRLAMAAVEARAWDDHFAWEADRLRVQGHTDKEIDRLLAHLP